MKSFPLCVVVSLCLAVTWAWALPKPPFSNGASSGAGEIPDEIPLDFRPFDGPLGKGPSSKEVDYDLDEAPQNFPDYYENELNPPPRPHGGASERPLDHDDRIPEEKHPEDEPRKEPEEEEDHEPPSRENPKGDEETHDDEEKEEAETKGGEEEPHGSEEEDTHAVEDEEKPHGDEEEETQEGEEKPHGDEEEETQEGEEKLPLPLNTALFSFQQVNHYIKQLEKAMEHVFQESLEEASLLNNTFANTTEEEVEVDGHRYKVQKSLIKTGDPDKNSTLFIEAVSSVSEDEPKKNRTERSNPDAEPIQ